MFDRNGSTRLYNTLMGNPDAYVAKTNSIGRYAGGGSGDNFFTKKAKSIENALGTTGATIVGGVNEAITNKNRDNMMKDNQTRMNEVAKKYGYNTYHDVWDARDKAEAEGDQATLDFINNTINPELQRQATANKNKMDKFASDYKDYVQNDYIGQKTNQDQGKFLGSAINTMSTATDVLGLTNGPLSNAIQGGLEGIADELEQSGFKDFSWERAGQNALTGAASGAVTGALNAKINGALAKRGGNLLKGGNKLTQAINNFNATNPVGQLASSLGTGAARGAISGAVGGATGAGISAAMNNQDVLGSALQGAKQGAISGAGTGAIMTGANMAIDKTPGVGKFLRNVNQAQQDWKNSGSNFDERLTNTLNSGDSAVGNWLNRRTQSNLLSSAGAIGNSIQDTSGANTVNPWDKLAQQSGYNNYDEVIQKYMEANPDTPLNPRGAAGQILTWLDQNPNSPNTVGGWLKRAGERVVEDANNRGVGLSVKDVSNNDQGYSNDIKNLKINQNDMLGYTDDNAEPITVEEALNRAGVNPSQRGTTQTMAEEVETRTNTKNPQTELYETLTTEKSSTENRLRNAAGLKLQEQYGTIDKPTAKATNAPETLQKIAKAGFTKPADVERMANAITGSNGEVSKLVANLVATAKPVNTFDGETSGQSLNDYIDLAIQKHGLDGISEGKAVKSQINALMKSLPSHAEGSISYVDDPTDTFKMTQLLDSEAANYEGRSGMNYGTTTPDKLRAAQVIKDVSGLLKDRIYETVDVKQALTPEVAENLKAYAPNNKEWANYVDNEIMTANSVKDLRSAQAPWVRANKIIDNGYMNSVTYGGRNGGNGAIPLTKRGLIGLALDATVNSKPGLRAQAKVLNKAADIAASKAQGGESVDNAPNVKAENIPNTQTEAPTNNVAPIEAPTNNVAPMTASSEAYNPSMNIYNVIGRNEGRDNAQQARTADYLVNAAQEAEVVNDNTGVGTTMSPQSTSVYNTLYGQTSGATQAQPTTSSTGYFQPTGDYWTDILASAMSKAIDADDVEAFAALYGMYQDQLSNISKNTEKDYSNPVNWNSTDRKSLLQAQNGLDQIDSLESSYNNAVGSGGSNLIQGTLRQWSNNISGGNLDPSAENYVKQANSIGAGIIKNLVNLGSTEYDAQRYIDYLPKLTDTKEQAAQKLQVLRNAYENVIQNLRDVYSA